MSGVGTGIQVVMVQLQKAVETQLVPCRGLAASTAVVVGEAIRIAVRCPFVTTTTRMAASSTLGSAWFVPVLSKITKCF